MPPNYDESIKVVGAIGALKSEGLTIPHYCPTFDKIRSSKNFRPSRLINCFTNIDLAGSPHSEKIYKSVLEGITRCAWLSDRKLAMDDGSEHPYTVSTIKQYLRHSGKFQEFNTQYLKILESTSLNELFWKVECGKLLDLVNLRGLQGDAISFVSYEPPHTLSQTCAGSQFNNLTLSTSTKPVHMEVATIHSVKGETHAATLVLETKFSRSYDIHSTLDHLLKTTTEQETSPQKKKFMKQLYVAMT